MTCLNSACIGDSDFERILFFARKRFIEGVDTITLMTQARDEQEKREVALAALLDLDDGSIRELQLFACDNINCKASRYRGELQQVLAGLQNQASGF